MTTMGPHSDCGKDIVWVRRADDNDRWMPPLEFAGQAIIIQDDEAVFVSTYRRHECDQMHTNNCKDPALLADQLLSFMHYFPEDIADYDYHVVLSEDEL